MITNEQLAWAAGFFDGEGYISIVARNNKVNDKHYTHQYLRVGINHVDPRPFLDTIGNTGQRISSENLQIRRDCASRLKLVNSQT